MTIKSLPPFSFKIVKFPPIQIVYTQMIEELSKEISKTDLDEYLILYQRALENPKRTYKLVEEFLSKHPIFSPAYNLLGYLYFRLKKIRKGNRLIMKHYQQTPKNLFAKINFADLCLRLGKVEKVPSIFEEKDELGKIYPERKFFHFSEVIGFYTLLGFYALKQKQKEKALDYCSYALMIDPQDKSAKHLAKKIAKKPILEHVLTLLKKGKTS